MAAALACTSPHCKTPCRSCLDALSGSVQALTSDLAAVRDAAAAGLRDLAAEVKQQAELLAESQREAAALVAQMDEGLKAELAQVRPHGVWLADGLNRACKRDLSATINAAVHCACSERQAGPSRVELHIRTALSDAVRNSKSSLLQARDEVSQRFEHERSESAAAIQGAIAVSTKASQDARTADLAVIERALHASHSNVVQSDEQLEQVIHTLKDLEHRVAATADQGDALAGSVNEIQQRVGALQSAMLADGRPQSS